jgi:hypothetical protein
VTGEANSVRILQQDGFNEARLVVERLRRIAPAKAASCRI